MTARWAGRYLEEEESPGRDRFFVWEHLGHGSERWPHVGVDELRKQQPADWGYDVGQSPDVGDLKNNNIAQLIGQQGAGITNRATAATCYQMAWAVSVRVYQRSDKLIHKSEHLHQVSRQLW